VLALLDLRRYGTVVLGALQQAGEGKVVLAVFWRIESAENLLDALEKVLCN